MRLPHFEYTWKIGFEYRCSRSLSTSRALSENKVLIDLYDGRRYAVQAVFPAGPNDREFEMMPDTAIQTWPAGSISEEKLASLRAMAGYVPDESARPLASMVF